MLKMYSSFVVIRVLGVGIAAGVCLFLWSAPTAALEGIAQSYKAADDVSPGALVSISPQDTASVELAARTNVNRLIGVVSGSPLIVLNATELSSVTVVTGGVTDVLVSDYNGQVKAGDKITASPIAGVGQKATESATIIGTARNDVTRQGGVTKTITDAGKTRTITINLVSVQVGVSSYAVPQQGSIVPDFVQDFANRVAGHEVPAIRVFIAMAIALLIFVGVIAVMHASVRSSIASIGRNPLSASSIRGSLFQVSFLVLVVVGLGSTIIYFLLKA